MQLERLHDESNTSYHKRLVYGKLVDKTLADVDYSELSEHVYGQQYSSDVARRMMYGSCKTLQMMEAAGECNSEGAREIEEIERRRLELQKERQRFFDQRREYNKLVTDESRREHLEARLIEAANKLKDTVGCVGVNVAEQCNLLNTEAILVLSDWHYGMVTDNVWNTYNTDICRARVRWVIESAIARIRLHGCRRVHIVILGDMANGAIHTSSRVASEELACDQLMEVSEILAQSIEAVALCGVEVVVHVTYGNHNRTVQRKEDSIHRDNMERLIPWWLKQRLKDNALVRIEEESENEFLMLDVCGYGFCATHGDLDSVRSAPRMLPVLFQKKYGKNIDYILLGDKHHRESFEELCVDAMICGSLCGTDDYANEKRLYSNPEQLLLIVNPEIGIDGQYRIKCK